MSAWPQINGRSFLNFARLDPSIYKPYAMSDISKSIPAGATALRLNPAKIEATALRIAKRIDSRFHGSGLSSVALEVHSVARASRETTSALKRPIWFLRFVNALLGASIAGILLYVLVALGPSFRFAGLELFIQLLEPALGSMVFIGAFILFVWGLENRWKRGRALDRLHELRSLAHVIDMHQLTKDPSAIEYEHSQNEMEEYGGPLLSRRQLHDYLDYCSELLSIIGKMGALYAQDLQEPSTLEAADRVETLTVGLSRKIWQKMLVLEASSMAAK